MIRRLCRLVRSTKEGPCSLACDPFLRWLRRPAMADFWGRLECALRLDYPSSRRRGGRPSPRAAVRRAAGRHGQREEHSGRRIELLHLAAVTHLRVKKLKGSLSDPPIA